MKPKKKNCAFLQCAVYAWYQLKSKEEASTKKLLSVEQIIIGMKKESTIDGMEVQKMMFKLTNSCK